MDRINLAAITYEFKYLPRNRKSATITLASPPRKAIILRIEYD